MPTLQKDLQLSPVVTFMRRPRIHLRALHTLLSPCASSLPRCTPTSCPALDPTSRLQDRYRAAFPQT